ncbi:MULTISPECIES: DUF5997 family protein [Actinomadura]|jgi:hypothetical protein|uniref:Uncharacterized protein n=1 Tax=Actinomadura citrea TaxID=46158 RepID=A0A7Y9G6N4_9ACTN|nr:DUF5997 family protein [Actinomadura citrea]NYE10726.1 hypothetical protein [Actinomadura citrea]GGT74388.1 hypothetical protein GCM10010177_35440 [Actinomadura citrea]
MSTSKAKTPQTMKSATAAKKLGILLSAAPAEFQEGPVSRDELNALQADPPSWLADLRREGPHPRQVVAAKLRVSASGLARAGITGPLTTAEIENLKAENPDWLEREQAVRARVREEELRLKQQRAKA